VRVIWGRAAVQIAFSFLVFTDIRLVPIEGWLATAMGRLRLSRLGAFSFQWHAASTHSDPR
jgi:hypothetical protein